MKKLLFILIVFSSCSHKATIVHVEDGDSFYTSSGEEIRIYGADCPEWTRRHNQPFGDVATNFTRNMIEGKTVTLEVMDHDKYHRAVCKVFLANGDDLSELLIKAGLAWTYSRYDPAIYCKEEREAKFNHVGLWIQLNPVSPYKFRRNEKTP
jgi:micrococcal nuclease